MAESLPFRAEYAKSGRASCKKCKSNIPKDEFRLARMVKSHHHDGQDPHWHHFDCFFEKKFNPAGVEQFANFENLRFEDQKRLEQAIEQSQSGPSTSAGKSGGKGKGASKRKAELDGDFTVEYAKSGQSKCKLCECAIGKAEVRLGKRDYESDDAARFGPLFRWFHVACFVTAREELSFFADADDLPNFENLEAKDKRELKKKLKATEPTSKPPQTPKIEVKGDDATTSKKDASKEDAKLKKQSDKMFKFIEELKKLRRGELLQLFAANDISFIPEDSNKRNDILADALTFGRPENCPDCGGYLRFKVSRYECTGNITEWEKCGYETETPKRRVFVVPEAMKEYDFLKDYKGKTGKRVFITKLKHNLEERKKQQLAQLVNVKSEGDISASGPSTSKPLEGYNVAILGKLPEVNAKVAQFGGKIVKSVTQSTAFMVALPKAFNTSKSKMVKDSDEFQIPVVSEAVFDLLDQGLPRAILQSEIALWDKTEHELEERLNNLNVKSKIKETFKGIGTSKKTLGVNKLVSKGGAVVDAETHLENDAHILKEGDSFYSAVLNCVDVAKNKNSFYKLQLLESDYSNNTYWVFRSWGRIGVSGDTKLEKFHDKYDAIQSFKRLYLDKTRNDWDNRKNFQKYPSFYFPVDVDYGEMETKLDLAVSTSTLPDPVKYLISLIFDVAKMKQTMLEFELDLDKMPLGKLSKAQLLEACSTLKEIAVLLESGSQNLNKIQGATNKFYSLVPHNFGNQCPELIKSAEMIALKMQMLESLMDLEIAYDLMKNEGGEEGEDPIDAHYKKLNAHLEPLPSDSAEFGLIASYMKNTHAKTHCNYKLELVNVFKVERVGEDDRFSKHRANENRMLLWHGSRLTNFAGILSQGLRIAPPEAPVCGYMFGKGVYFADSVSKSANYCATSRYSNEGLMLLSEVAIGQSKELYNAEFVTNLPKKFHSVKGVGGTHPDPKEMHVMEDGVKVPLGKMIKNQTDKNTSLLYNEYIVYNEEQIKLRYLLNVKFNYD